MSGPHLPTPHGGSPSIEKPDYWWYVARSELLRTVLKLIVMAWGKAADNFQGSIILGLALTLHRHAAEVDGAVLLKKLQSHPGGALGLLGRGRAIHQAMSGSVAHGVARAVVLAYNAGRGGKSRLPLEGE